MKLALECPTALLEDIQPLADYDFILTHLVLRDKEYAEYYAKSTRYKILDNSTNELLKPCSLEDIAEAARIVKPHLIVAPDFLGDHVATQSILCDTVRKFGMKNILPVVQGKRYLEAMLCADYIIRSGFGRIAVPYDINSDRSDGLLVMASARQRVVNYIIGRVPIDFKIHLLGMSTLEELRFCNRGWVTSIDTGSPVRHGMYRVQFGKDELQSKVFPTMEVMEAAPEVNFPGIYYNIAYLRKVLNND